MRLCVSSAPLNNPLWRLTHGAICFYDSYGYPLAASVKNVSAGDGSRPELARVDRCDRSLTGVVTDMPADAAHRANLFSVILDPPSSNYRIGVDRFIPNVLRPAGFDLAVIDPSKPAMAVVLTSDMSGNIRRDTVRYQGIAISTVAPGTTSTMKAIINRGNLSRLIVRVDLSEGEVKTGAARGRDVKRGEWVRGIIKSSRG